MIYAFKQTIKGILIYLKHKINQCPLLKKAIMKVLSFFPILEKRLVGLGHISNDLVIEGNINYIPEPTPNSEKIFIYLTDDKKEVQR